MRRGGDQWIIVPNWDKFQHYTYRRPLWIKNYTDLLRKDEYLDLTHAERGVLHLTWLAYADHNGILTVEKLCGKVQTQTRLSQIEALVHAGLIEVSASKKTLTLNTELHARAREDAETPAVRRARAWIRNGAAREIPAARLAEVLADEFKIDDPTTVAALVAQAQEWT